MLNDRDAHWWLSLDPESGRLILNGRFGSLPLLVDPPARRRRQTGRGRNSASEDSSQDQNDIA